MTLLAVWMLNLLVSVVGTAVYMALYKLSKPGLRYEERKQLRRDLGPSETFVHGFHGSQIRSERTVA